MTATISSLDFALARLAAYCAAVHPTIPACGYADLARQLSFDAAGSSNHHRVAWRLARLWHLAGRPAITIDPRMIAARADVYGTISAGLAGLWSIVSDLERGVLSPLTGERFAALLACLAIATRRTYLMPPVHRIDVADAVADLVAQIPVGFAGDPLLDPSRPRVTK